MHTSGVRLYKSCWSFTVYWTKWAFTSPPTTTIKTFLPHSSNCVLQLIYVVKPYAHMYITPSISLNILCSCMNIHSLNVLYMHAKGDKLFPAPQKRHSKELCSTVGFINGGYLGVRDHSIWVSFLFSFILCLLNKFRLLMLLRHST